MMNERAKAFQDMLAMMGAHATMDELMDWCVSEFEEALNQEVAPAPTTPRYPYTLGNV
jgi:hypothetical protein